MIDGVCGKQGLRYETFAKSLSLADFSRLVRSVETAVKAVGREGGSKQQVDGVGGGGTPVLGNGVLSVSQCQWDCC